MAPAAHVPAVGGDEVARRRDERELRRVRPAGRRLLGGGDETHGDRALRADRLRPREKVGVAR